MKIGIVIPAHNEEYYLSACLQSIQLAIAQIKQDQVKVLVVLDNCTDQSRLIVQSHQVDWIACDYTCVGRARDIGVRYMIDHGINWIACTDADSLVEPDWLLQQLQHQPTDAICGVVMLNDFSHLSSAQQQRYLVHYQDQMGHQHIHGANLSFSVEAYVEAGGFEAIPCHEDVLLIQKFITQCRHITWSNLVRVTTSSRLNGRAPQGLSHFLNQL